MTDYLHLDGGTGAYVVASGYRGVSGDPGGIEAISPRTVAFWIRSTQSGVASSVMYWGDGFTPEAEIGAQNRIRLATKGRVQLFGQGSYRETASGILDNQWHHVVVTYSGGLRGVRGQLRVSNFADADVYLDGELNNGRWFEDGISGVINPDESDVVIGARPILSGTLTDFFEGDLDEVAIWRTVLPPTVISGVYNGGVRGGVDLNSLPESHALELWYDFDGPGDTAPNGGLVNRAFSPQFPFPGSGITGSGTSILT
jgi:hypothetical protein